MPPRSAVGTRRWHERIRPRVLRRDRYTCQLCHRVFSASELEVDHIVPRVAGGTDAMENLRALCRDCHKLRSAGATIPQAKPTTEHRGLPPLFRRYYGKGGRIVTERHTWTGERIE